MSDAARSIAASMRMIPHLNTEDTAYMTNVDTESMNVEVTFARAISYAGGRMTTEGFAEESQGQGGTTTNTVEGFSAVQARRISVGFEYVITDKVGNGQPIPLSGRVFDTSVYVQVWVKRDGETASSSEVLPNIPLWSMKVEGTFLNSTERNYIRYWLSSNMQTNDMWSTVMKRGPLNYLLEGGYITGTIILEDMFLAFRSLDKLDNFIKTLIGQIDAAIRSWLRPLWERGVDAPVDAEPEEPVFRLFGLAFQSDLYPPLDEPYRMYANTFYENLPKADFTTWQNSSELFGREASAFRGGFSYEGHPDGFNTQHVVIGIGSGTLATEGVGGDWGIRFDVTGMTDLSETDGIAIPQRTVVEKVGHMFMLEDLTDDNFFPGWFHSENPLDEVDSVMTGEADDITDMDKVMIAIAAEGRGFWMPSIEKYDPPELSDDEIME